MFPNEVTRLNQLLTRLPGTEGKRFAARCEEVELEFGHVIVNRGEPLTHAYFPTGGYISLIARVDGANLEVGMVGNEGMAGTSLGLGVEDSSICMMVQGAGNALRINAKDFNQELGDSHALRTSVGRYTHAVMSQFAQTAGCNRYHLVEQRLARWLLMTADRAHSEAFDITHEFLAAMLGVRRVGVTNAAGELQARELIRYTRGHLHILDRKGLEHAACSCYKADLASYAKDCH